MPRDNSPRAFKKRPDVSDAQPSNSVIAVTAHARLRYLQRVNSDSPNPNEQLRRIFKTGVPAGEHPAVEHGRARRSGDLIVVYRGSETAPDIVTVLVDRTGPER
ncbi:MAG: hypothetical protein A07HR60_02303 [uncultured archaeon A07HR60]|nr:MAG: hypothetical protein A07HR60_02303 [uncultured archaeon A07HR60]